MGDLAAGDPHDAVFGSELADGEAHPLHSVVDRINVVVGGGGDGHRAAVEGVSDPVFGDDVEMVEERAGDDPAVRLVGVQRSRAPGSQLQGGRCFPPLGEPVETGQFVHPACGTQLGEQAAPTHGLELAGVADESEAPSLAVGQIDETHCAHRSPRGFAADSRREPRRG